MHFAKFIMAVFLCSGTWMLYMASEENDKINYLLEFGVEAEGVVIANVKKSTSEGHSYNPRFEYHDEIGISHVAEGDVSSNPPAYVVGEKVKLLYVPGNFNEVKVKSWWGLNAGLIISLTIGIAHLSIGGIYFGRKIYKTFQRKSRVVNSN